MGRGTNLMKDEQSSSIREFLQRVKNQIRSKEAVDFVERELQAHINERKSEYMTNGYSNTEAEEIVIKQMGNPTSLGAEMHNIHKPKVDWFLIAIFSIVLSLGTAPYYFIPFELYHINFQHKLFFSALSFIVVISLMYIDYRKITKQWVGLFAIAVILSYLPVFLDESINGHVVIAIGMVRINFWFISLFYLISFAGMLSSFARKEKQLWIATFVMVWLPIVVFLKNGYLPLAVFYYVTVVIITLLSQLPKKQIKQLLYINGISMLLAVSALIMNYKPYQTMRLHAFLSPESDPNGSGYIYLKLQELLHGSTFWGQGLSYEKSFLFPDISSEFIFALLVVNLGWLFGGMLILSIGLFLFRMFYTVHKTKDPSGIMIVTAGGCMIGFAAISNLLMVLGYIPIVGIPLPFISHGGQFQLLYSIYIGLILSVYRRKDLVQIQAV